MAQAAPDQAGDHFRASVLAMDPAPRAIRLNVPVTEGSGLSIAACLKLFDAQLASRHADAAARWLRAKGAGFYTIGSSGHEGNAGVAAALRLTDPALLHYRSGALLPGPVRAGEPAARRHQRHPARPGRGGRGADRGRPAQGVRPPAAGRHPADLDDRLAPAARVGLAFALSRAAKLGVTLPWPRDAIVVCSFGDASANHSTAAGALNAAAYCSLPGPAAAAAAGLRGQRPRHQRADRRRAGSPRPSRAGRRSKYFQADGADLAGVYDAALEAAAWAPGPAAARVPAPVHGAVRRPRGLGRGVGLPQPRPRSPPTCDRDPLVATARLLVACRRADPVRGAGPVRRQRGADHGAGRRGGRARPGWPRPGR